MADPKTVVSYTRQNMCYEWIYEYKFSYYVYSGFTCTILVTEEDGMRLLDETGSTDLYYTLEQDSCP
ncbi:hypothetical protein CHS0354_022774 [Potamilus streckersoni]|uniref:Uncharacterized protein n=1 Tax=Potamilus streckersoni TaxID=2493646 RepID=A0AAE0VN49_9BIVA|nr:hypothetical protein CHS0354_022774 [Potamilus streckersoni]